MAEAGVATDIRISSSFHLRLVGAGRPRADATRRSKGPYRQILSMFHPQAMPMSANRPSSQGERLVVPVMSVEPRRRSGRIRGSAAPRGTR